VIPRRGPAALFDPTILRRAGVDALRKLDPRLVARNPVMFVVEIGSVVTTVVLLLLSQGFARPAYVDVALLLAVLSMAGSLVFARFLGRSL